jgi:methylmalonyl-CoA mutase N-terminal domain/subunit
MEKFGGYTSEAAIHYLKDDIQRIREKRMEEIATIKRTVVGINKYFNPDSSNLQWKHEIESYLGVKHFIAEQMLNKVDTE